MTDQTMPSEKSHAGPPNLSKSGDSELTGTATTATLLWNGSSLTPKDMGIMIYAAVERLFVLDFPGIISNRHWIIANKNTWLLGLPANTASHVTACFSGMASWPSLEPSNSCTPITHVSWRMAIVRQLKEWMWVLIYLSKHFIVQPWWLSSGHCFAQASTKLFPTCISWRRTQTITYYYCTNFYPWDVHQWVGWASSKAQQHLWLCTILGTCFFWWPLRRGQGATP